MVVKLLCYIPVNDPNDFVKQYEHTGESFIPLHRFRKFSTDDMFGSFNRERESNRSMIIDTVAVSECKSIAIDFHLNLRAKLITT